jgi:hypothetical protein
MSFYGVIVGELKGNPQVEKTEYTNKDGALVEMPISLLRIGTKRYDVTQRKQVLDTFTITTTGKTANKVSSFRKGDEVAAEVILQPHQDGIVYFARNVVRVGEEGLNLHFIVGAVEKVDFDYVGSNNIEKTSASVRVPVEKFDGTGKVNNNIRTQSWRRVADNVNNFFSPGFNDSGQEENFRRWGLFKGNTINRYAEVNGESRFYFTFTIDGFEPFNARTEAWSNEQQDNEPVKGYEAKSPSKAALASLSHLNDDDIPF